MRKGQYEQIKSLQHLKNVVAPGVEFSVGFQHEHRVTKVVDDGFYWECVTGDCCDDGCVELVRYTDVGPDDFDDEVGLYVWVEEV